MGNASPIRPRSDGVRTSPLGYSGSMSTVVRTRPDPVVRDASRVLERNWCTGRTSAGRPFAFTAPDIRKFPAQFYWDSCFHAIAWAAVDPRRARAELRTLLAAAEPDGFIGHTIFWDAPVRHRGGRSTTSSRAATG